jgi:hypothetical protein
MLDFNLTSLTETNRHLLRIAEALERLAPVPPSIEKKKPRDVTDLLIGDDSHFADLEDEEQRKRAVLEGDET